MTKLVLETINGTYTIQLAEEIDNCWDLVTDVIRPALLAAGYAPATVIECLGLDQNQ